MASTKKLVKFNSSFNHLLWFFLLFFTYMFVPSILALIYAAAQGIALDAPEFVTIGIFAQTVGLFPVLALALYFTRQLFIEDWQKTKKNILLTIGLIVAGVMAIFFLSGIVGVIYEKLGIEGTSENQESLEVMLASKYGLVMIISIVIFAPILEELIFRKFLFGIAEEKFKWPGWAAILISSLVFSLVHLTSGDFEYILLYLPQALVMGVLYHYSKNNIFVSIGIHFLNNLIAVIGIFVLGGIG